MADFAAVPFETFRGQSQTQRLSILQSHLDPQGIPMYLERVMKMI